MPELPIFELFLSVGNIEPKTQVVFQAKTQAKTFSVELGPRFLPGGGVVRRRQPCRRILLQGSAKRWALGCVNAGGKAMH